MLPEGKEFSLNPEEKYLYMDFYDLKSVLANGLSSPRPPTAQLFWLRNAELEGSAAKYCAAWQDKFMQTNV